MSTKPRMNLNMLGNDLKDSAKQSLQGLGSLNLSQEGNRTSVPDTAPRTFKRISYQKIKSSELNDYPIDNIEEMEQLLLQYGLLNPLNVTYITNPSVLLMPCAPPKRLMNLPKFILDKIKTYRKNNVSTSINELLMI